MTTQQRIDQAKTNAFVGKVLADTAGLAVTVMSSIGDRLGLFKTLAGLGPATSEELAERAHVNERYAREWLSAMASAGYLEYDAATRRFTLPPEHVPVLAQEGGPVFFGGVQEEMVGLAGPVNQLMQAFRSGGGVPMEAYDPSTWEGVTRFTSGWFKSAGAGVAFSDARGAGKSGTWRSGCRCGLWAGQSADQAGPDLPAVALRGLRQLCSIHRASHG